MSAATISSTIPQMMDPLMSTMMPMIATMTAMIHNRLGDMTTPPPLTVATATARIRDPWTTPTAATNERHRGSTTRSPDGAPGPFAIAAVVP
jgi:hypothetical protein